MSTVSILLVLDLLRRIHVIATGISGFANPVFSLLEMIVILGVIYSTFRLVKLSTIRSAKNIFYSLGIGAAFLTVSYASEYFGIQRLVVPMYLLSTLAEFFAIVAVLMHIRYLFREGAKRVM